MDSDILYYICAAIAVIMTGLAKGGFAGVGAVSMPLLALRGDPLAAAAILLPILIVQDAISIFSYWRNINKRIVFIMLPSMALGVYLGFLFADALPRQYIMGMVGIIALSFGAHNLWKKRSRKPQTATKGHPVLGLVSGVVTGFTSQIAHAGGPPFHVWVLPQKLHRDVLVGTKAICFGFLNWIKVPAFFALGQMTTQNLKTSAILLPLAIAATFFGVYLVKRVETEKFYTIIYILMCLLGMKLIYEGFF